MKPLLRRSALAFTLLVSALCLPACETDGGSTDGTGDGSGSGGVSALHCNGAEGDKAVAPDDPVGVSLPAKRTCLDASLTEFLQGPKGNTVPAAMVADGAGNLYVAGDTKAFMDSTYGDLFIGKLDGAGKVGWLKTYGTDKKDTFPTTGVHDPSNGVEGMLAIDGQGDLYAVGNYTGNHGFALKVGADGSPKWSVGVAKAAFQAVSVAKGLAHVAGDKGIYALDAATGASKGQLGFKLKSGAQSRMFAVHATDAGPIYLGGWAGFSGDDDAVLSSLTHDGKAYAIAWSKRVPSPKGAKISSLDTASDGALYVGLNVTGAADVRVEILKFGADGKLTWARRYGDTIQSQTNVVKVVGDRLVVGGNSLPTGSATFSDSKHGDGLLLLVGADGSLLKEHYFFTGTNPASYDAVRDVELVGGKLMVISHHYGAASFGEWRDPNEYGDGKLKHEWKTVATSEYLITDAGLENPTLDAPAQLSDVQEIPDGKWNDVTANVAVKVAEKGADDGKESAVFTVIDGYTGQ